LTVLKSLSVAHRGRRLSLAALAGVLAAGAGSAVALGAAPGTAVLLQSNRGVDMSQAECNAHGGCGPTVRAPVVLAAGQSYTIRVTGTISVWGTWSNPCGHPEPRPEYLTPGVPVTPTGDDAVFRFANHTTNRDCRTLPRKTGLFQINLGSGWFSPTAVGNPSSPHGNQGGEQHPYTFRVTGQGKPPQFRYVDFHPSDNDGALKIVISAEPGTVPAR
jgi:hypothetical protein